MTVLLKRKKALYRIILLFCAAWVSGLAHAAYGWQPIVRNYSPQDYAAGTQNWRIMQSEKGWIYAANNYGLLEFDGESWNIYGIWNSTALHSLAAGPDGSIYVGGSNDFGVFTPDEDAGMLYRPLTDSLPATAHVFGDVWNMAYDDGIIYITTRNHIFVRQPGGHTEVIDPASIVYASLLQDHCLYLATSNGIYVYSGHRLHTIEGSQLLLGLTISAMAPYDEHSFLIATDFNGVYLCDGTSIRRFVTDVDGFFHRNQLYSMSVSEHKIAFGTVLRGLVVTDLEGHNPVFVNRRHGLQNNTVLSLAFDREENLWLGMDQGIDVVMLNSPLEFLNDKDEDYGSGYAYLETADGMYFGTNQGLYFKRKDSSVLELVDGSLGQVWRLVSMNGELFCCHNRGLFRIAGLSLEKLPIPDGVWNVIQTEANQALACTYSGFYLLAKVGAEYQVVQHVNGYEETVLYAEQDPFGNIWTISSRGVERISFAAGFSRLNVQLMLPDPQRTRYAISKLGNNLIVSAEGYLAVVQPDGSLREDAELAEKLDGAHKYELMAKDASGNLLYMHDARLLLRAYDSEKEVYSESQYAVVDDYKFFVGGFANMKLTDDGCAVLGAIDGFYRMDIEHALGLSESAPWEKRPVKVFVPWYMSWWAILIYIALFLLFLFLSFTIVRSRIRMRDERLAAEKMAEIHQQQMRILELERERVEYNLKAKSKELNSVLLNQVNRNEMAQSIQQDVHRIYEILESDDKEGAKKALRQLETRLGAGMHADKDWQRFEENFDFVNDSFIRKLSDRFPWMNKQERKLCVYIYMGLQTKEIAPLLNLSNRGVEMMRYRTRRKMELDAQANLKAYFEEMVAEDEAAETENKEG